MARKFDYDVFLSHNLKDKARVRVLAERLKGAGFRVWLDEWVIKPGDDIYLAIERGIETSRVQLLCMSAASLESGWVGMERSAVLFRDPVNAARRFIPLLLDNCELPDALRRYKHIDFRDESQSALDELIGALQSSAPISASVPVVSDTTHVSEDLREGKSAIEGAGVDPATLEFEKLIHDNPSHPTSCPPRRDRSIAIDHTITHANNTA